MLETFLWEFCSSWHVGVTVIADLPALHPWNESPVPPRTKHALLDWDLVTVEAICPVQPPTWDGFSFVTCQVILLEEASEDHNRIKMVSSNTLVVCGILMLLSWFKGIQCNTFRILQILTLPSNDEVEIFYCSILVCLCELYPKFPVLNWQEWPPLWSYACWIFFFFFFVP